MFQFVPSGGRRVFYPGLPDLHVIHISRDGNYGEAIRQCWSHAYGTSEIGMIVLEYDMAVPLEAWQEMNAAIAESPNRVIAIPYKIYPASTKMDRPVWAHRLAFAGGPVGYAPADRPCPRNPVAFGLGATFLPSRLLLELPDDLTNWVYPTTDTRMSRLAHECGIAIVATQTEAVHLHY